MDLSGSWGYIERIARSRLAHNKTTRHVYQYGPEIEVLGAAGEICARRFLGLSEVLHEEFDHGVDINFNGFEIDVKATHLTPKISYRFLQWPTWKTVKAPFIMMTAVSMEKKIGVVLGYVTKAQVIAAPVNQARKIPCHEIPVTALRPPWELFEKSLQRGSGIWLD